MYRRIHRTLSVLSQEKRYRPLIRAMMVLYIPVLGLLLSLNILEATAKLDPEAILDLQRSNLAVAASTTLLGITGATSMGLLWVLMLHHWRTHDFKSADWKNLWLAALLFGNIALTPVYYVLVFELGKTLRSE